MGEAKLGATYSASPVRSSWGEGVALSPPEVPVLIMFTQSEGKRGLLHIECMFRDRPKAED